MGAIALPGRFAARPWAAPTQQCSRAPARFSPAKTRPRQSPRPFRRPYPLCGAWGSDVPASRADELLCVIALEITAKAETIGEQISRLLHGQGSWTKSGCMALAFAQRRVPAWQPPPLPSSACLQRRNQRQQIAPCRCVGFAPRRCSPRGASAAGALETVVPQPAPARGPSAPLRALSSNE